MNVVSFLTLYLVSFFPQVQGFSRGPSSVRPLGEIRTCNVFILNYTQHNQTSLNPQQ